MSSINFFAEGVPSPLANDAATRQWIDTVVAGEHQEIEELTFIFCSDEYLLRINQDYLNHDTYTDIITFDLREQPEGPLEGEIYISTERVYENAAAFGSTFPHELHRVIIHGVWHLMGQGDKSEEESQQMRAKEDQSLALIAASL